MKTKNVLVVRHHDQDQHLILPEVVEHLKRRGLRAHMVWGDIEPNIKHALWTMGQETAVISLRPLKRFLPKWPNIKIYDQVLLDKLEEGHLMMQAGIPMPKWTVIHEGEEADLSGFSDYVVTKPAGACRGAFVKVMKKTRVRWRKYDLNERRADTDSLIVQEYIHTGPLPVSYRVVTMFGEPIFMFRARASIDRPAIDFTYHKFNKSKRNEDLGNNYQGFGGKCIVSSSKGCTMDGEVPDDVIDLARQTHKAFPHIPLVGSDIIRDVETGKLYVLEANTNAWTFVMVSDVGESIKRQFGLDFKRQFGGAKAMAKGIDNHLNNSCSCKNSETLSIDNNTKVMVNS